jgi:hypothetical protein
MATIVGPQWTPAVGVSVDLWMKSRLWTVVGRERP